jgi:hypothetical protein
MAPARISQIAIAEASTRPAISAVVARVRLRLRELGLKAIGKPVSVGRVRGLMSRRPDLSDHTGCRFKAGWYKLKLNNR